MSHLLTSSLSSKTSTHQDSGKESKQGSESVGMAAIGLGAPGSTPTVKAIPPTNLTNFPTDTTDRTFAFLREYLGARDSQERPMNLEDYQIHQKAGRQNKVLDTENKSFIRAACTIDFHALREEGGKFFMDLTDRTYYSPLDVLVISLLEKDGEFKKLMSSEDSKETGKMNSILKNIIKNRDLVIKVILDRLDNEEEIASSCSSLIFCDGKTHSFLEALHLGSPELFMKLGLPPVDPNAYCGWSFPPPKEPKYTEEELKSRTGLCRLNYSKYAGASSIPTKNTCWNISALYGLTNNSPVFKIIKDISAQLHALCDGSSDVPGTLLELKGSTKLSNKFSLNRFNLFFSTLNTLLNQVHTQLFSRYSTQQATIKTTWVALQKDDVYNALKDLQDDNRCLNRSRESVFRFYGTGDSGEFTQNLLDLCGEIYAMYTVGPKLGQIRHEITDSLSVSHDIGKKTKVVCAATNMITSHRVPLTMSGCDGPARLSECLLPGTTINPSERRYVATKLRGEDGFDAFLQETDAEDKDGMVCPTFIEAATVKATQAIKFNLGPAVSYLGVETTQLKDSNSGYKQRNEKCIIELTDTIPHTSPDEGGDKSFSLSSIHLFSGGHYTTILRLPDSTFVLLNDDKIECEFENISEVQQYLDFPTSPFPTYFLFSSSP